MSVIYSYMSRRAKGEHAKVLAHIAEAENGHAEIWAKYTGKIPSPATLKIIFYLLCGLLFGLTFVINILEMDDDKAKIKYDKLKAAVPEAVEIFEKEEEHERRLLSMIDDERLQYISSMVLGINDALVELTGALAGFTFALGDSHIICMAGFITGSAATLSMAASEYLSKKNSKENGHPLKAAVYTGIAYMFAVCMLLIPFAVIETPVIALAGCLFNAAIVIMLFRFYVSVVRKEPFLPAFIEMICISFGVAAVSFVIGWIAQKVLGISV